MSEKRKMPPGFGAKDTPEQIALRAEAKSIGLSIRGRPKAEKMRQLIADHKASLEAAASSPDPEPPKFEEIKEPDTPVERAVTDEQVAVQILPQGKLYLTEEEYQKTRFSAEKRGAGRLVRCRITNMNPVKKDWTGEIVSVGSSQLGTFKKFIPYDLDQPYHIPWIIFQHLKERECAVRSTRKTETGREVVVTKMIKEFAIEELPPLTREELEDMRKQQAMARGAA